MKISLHLRSLCLAAGLTTMLVSPGCATFASDLTAFRSAVDVADMVIDAIDDFANSYFTAHPDPSALAQIQAAEAQARAAAAAALSIANGAGDASNGNVAQAFQDFENAYSSLLALAQSLGVRVAAPGAKVGVAATPGVLTVPAPADLRPAMVKEVAKGASAVDETTQQKNLMDAAANLRKAMSAGEPLPPMLRSPGNSTSKTGPTFLGVNSDGTWVGFGVPGTLPLVADPGEATAGLPRPELVPAILCLNGTVLRKDGAGKWNCHYPSEALSGNVTLTAPLTFSRGPVDWTGWMRVRGGALVKWYGNEIGWEAITLQPTQVTATPGPANNGVGMGSLDRAPEKAGNGTAAQAASRAGRSGRLDSRERPVPVTLAFCDVACGGPRTSLAPPGGCLCHVGNGMAAHWVPLREMAGAGLVAAR